MASTTHSDPSAPLRLGLVGYGNGGRIFHAPHILAAQGVELAGVVARSTAKKEQLAEELPGVPVFDSLTELLAAGVDAVTITTPPATRRELVLEALEAGVHVVADKPFAPSAPAAVELAEAAEARGLVLAVYHNRRFDTDVLALRDVLDSGRIGDVWRVHSRFDLDEPGSLEAGPDGGLLRDLGSHVVDQMVWLLGDVAAVSAQLDDVDLPEGRTDAGFVITLRHTSGTVSYVSASKINQLEAKGYRVYGSDGGYESTGKDGQGDYSLYYEAFAAAVRGEGPVPSGAREGVRTLAVLDAARRSADEGGWVAVEGS